MATTQTQPLAESAPDNPAAPDTTRTVEAIRAEISRAEISRGEISRRNSLLSTGPVSPQGKDAVRLNALKTGLYSKTILLPHEDRAAYDAIGADLARTYDPQTEPERRLLRNLHDTAWRIERIVAIETNLHLIGGIEQAASIQTRFGIDDPLDSFALGYVQGYLVHARAFDQINKQEVRLRKLQDRQLLELSALIACRAPLAPSPAQQQPPRRSGFVSPKSDSTPPAPPETGVLDNVPQHILDRMPNFTGKTAATHQKQWLAKHWPGR